jgi:hypothetical protein
MNDQENIREIVEKNKVTWDEKKWKEHWAEQKEGHMKRLAEMHREARK